MKKTTCTQCSSMLIRTQYLEEHRALSRICRSCGFSWYEKSELLENLSQRAVDNAKHLLESINKD